MSVIPFPVAVPDDALLHHVAQQAHAEHLHLVIDRKGRCVLTPLLLPGMVKINAPRPVAA